MKLIYISHWRFPSEKTMSPLIMKTCEEFAGVGFDVELWVPRRRNFFWKGKNPYLVHNVAQTFTIRRIPVVDLLGLIPGKIPFLLMVGSFNCMLFLNILFRQLSEQTVFYFHDIRDSLFLIPFKFSAFCEIHDFYKSSIDKLNRWAFQRMSGFIVTNRIKINSLKREYSISDNCMLHQPNGVDISQFSIDITLEEARKSLNLVADKKIVLYAGHLFGWKGVYTLLKAAKFLPANFLVYFVGGTDEDIQKFQVKSEKLNLKNVVITGRKPHKEIPLWLRAADVLVLPNTAKEAASKYETSPVKLFEYMASGRPIVASDLPSIRNIVDESMVSFAEADNPRSFAATIIRTLSESDSAEHRAKIARQEVRRYAWNARTRAITNFIEYIRVGPIKDTYG